MAGSGGGAGPGAGHAHKTSTPASLRAIAALKVVQSLALFGVALGAFHLLRPDVAVTVQEWTRRLSLQGEATMIQQGAVWVTGLLPHQVVGIGAGASLYGTLFAVEAVGLWQQRVWAEWLTVIATGLLIPVELYEVVRGRSLLAVLALAVNVIVVWLLVRQLRRVR